VTGVTIPRGMMPVYALPTPAVWGLADTGVRSLADWRSGGVLLHGVPDAQVRPDVYELHYPSIPATVANAIWAHFRDWGKASFGWLIPGTGDVIQVTHVSPPSINWLSTMHASARVRLERAIAHN
jgi:hypothetical protein